MCRGVQRAATGLPGAGHLCDTDGSRYFWCLLASSAVSTTTDGRSARWDAHRQQRRVELVEAALHAIREHGASVGMDEIATSASTSKTVFYRHFTDRSGLYRAVAERVDELILRDVGRVVGQSLRETDLAELDEDPRSLIAAAVRAYLHLVERDPEVYRFIVSAPIVVAERAGNAAEVAADTTGRMALQIGDLIAQGLVARGSDPAPARVWGLSLVGMVRAAADAWLAGEVGEISADELTEQLTDLAWHGAKTAWSPAHRSRA